jgi:hypothetical protein
MEIGTAVKKPGDKKLLLEFRQRKSTGQWGRFPSPFPGNGGQGFPPAGRSVLAHSGPQSFPEEKRAEVHVPNIQV